MLRGGRALRCCRRRTCLSHSLSVCSSYVHSRRRTADRGMRSDPILTRTYVSTNPKFLQFVGITRDRLSPWRLPLPRTKMRTDGALARHGRSVGHITTTAASREPHLKARATPRRDGSREFERERYTCSDAETRDPEARARGDLARA